MGQNLAFPERSRRISWTNIAFLSFVHFVALGGTVVVLMDHGPTLAAAGMFAFWTLACSLSITAGYHRLFAHGTYRAHPLVRAFFLFFGAASFQNSALKWASDHRRHHRFVDEDEDPYNIQKGFWWAHVGWVFFNDPREEKLEFVGDLKSDPMIRFQHRFYVPLGILAGFVLPLAVGVLLGDPWGVLVAAGFLRLVLVYHGTFCVNSLAHLIGAQPYSDQDSSRDSAITALVTFGEGYHNFHHRFPYDYRNGVRGHQFDPTKWLIRALHWAGLASDVVEAPPEAILKARIQMHERKAEGAVLAAGMGTLRRRLDRLLEGWELLRTRLASWKLSKGTESRRVLRRLRRRVRAVRRHVHGAYRDWLRGLHRAQLARSAPDSLKQV